MKLQKLHLTDYRRFADLAVEFHEHLNVLVGANGCGKSSILEALCVGLSWVVAEMRGGKGQGRHFADTDVRNGAGHAVAGFSASLGERQMEWQLVKAGRGRRLQAKSDFGPMREAVRMAFPDQGADAGERDVPLFVHYSVNRAVLDIPLRIRTRHRFDALAAYDDALTAGGGRFRVFFEWFREREDLENQLRLERSTSYRDRQLEAVRRAIEIFTGLQDLHISRNPLRMELRKGVQLLNVQQLSDGEKCALALVGDLARRLAIASPTLEHPLDGRGVVMIDEIELHLHPGWQHRAVDALTRTFPNCQFILTTHSPQVISNVRAESVFLLRECDGQIVVEQPEASYGLDVNYVLEVLMETDKRQPALDARVDALLASISAGELASARQALMSLRAEMEGTPPDLLRAEILLHRREVLAQRQGEEG